VDGCRARVADGIHQVATWHLAWSDQIVTDHLGAVMLNDHLVLGGDHVDGLAYQCFRDQIARRPEANAAAFIHRP